MLRRTQTNGGVNRPFKSHYGARSKQLHGDIESNHFSSPSQLRHQDRHAEPVSRIHSHPAIDLSNDIPLDAFDKQLLAEIPHEPQQSIIPQRDRGFLPQPRSNPSRNHQFKDAFMSKSSGSTRGTADPADDLHDIGPPIVNASSPAGLASSPTVAALENRRAHLSVRHADHLSTGATSAQTRSGWETDTNGSSTQSRKRPSQDNSNAYKVQKKMATPSLSRKFAPKPTVGYGPPAMRGIQLVPTSEMPDKIKTVFPYEVLNAVQSKCYPTAFQSDSNLVVSAPTGSGKTAIMELAICRIFMTSKTTDFKIIYQAPTKALCNERYHDWASKFQILGLECAELTGDTEFDHLRKVQQANIIITTPEKWDSITRKWRDNIKLVQMIKLFLVDEVHMLKDHRGATLEAVISRMKSMGTDVRFVALSATIPNSEDIAIWLGRDAATCDQPAVREVFDDSFRPVRLDKHVYGYQCNGNEFAFDNMVRAQIPDIIVAHGKRRPTMVFCMTRKSAAQTATTLANFYNASGKSQPPWPRPAASISVSDIELGKMVHTGVAFHHGGLSPDDRSSVERGFLQSNISILCSTSTLAVGVNLPCYLVVLQGTSTWTGTGAQSYSDLEIMQMLGRAGRPQFETSACAVILTRDHQASRYQNLVAGNEFLESTLHRNLIEHLNAEIGLGTIYDKDSAQRWLASTFLRVRVARNPKHYRLDESSEGIDADTLIQTLCEKDLGLLLNAEVITGQGRLKCTPLGESMARYLVKFETIQIFTAMPPRAKLSDILSAVTQAVEFSDVRFRAGEKNFYKDLNKNNDIMFPINVDVATTAHKISLILQAELGGVSLPDGEAHRKHYQQYGIEKNVVFQHAKRLMRCILDCQLHMKDSTSVKNTLELSRSIAVRAWDRTPRQLKQLPDIGDVSVRKLAARGIQRIDDLLNSEPHQIEMALGRPAPFGNKLLKKLDTYPLLRVSIKETGRNMKPGKGADLKLLCQIGFLNDKVPKTFSKTDVYVSFLVEDSNCVVIDFRRLSAVKVGSSHDVFLNAHLNTPTTGIRCHVMCDDILGTCRYAELEVRGIAANIFPTNSSALPKNKTRDSVDTSRKIARQNQFSDEGVGDQDLIAVSKQGEIEVVDDIDDLLLAAEKDNQTLPVKEVARKSSMKKASEDSSQWKEPKQLPNGRWTCQHTCVDRGIDCKHQCCHEGSIRPKKQPTQSARSDVSDNKRPKITSMAGVSNISVKQAAPKLDGGSKASDAEKQETEEADTIEVIMRDFRAGKSSQTPLDVQTASTTTETGGVRRAKQAARASTSTIDHSNPMASSDAIFDVEEDAFDAIDCDWVTSYSISCNDELEGETGSTDAVEVPSFETILHTKQSADAPLSHVSMQDVQKHPDPEFSRVRQSSSPLRSVGLDSAQHDSSNDVGEFEDMFDDDPSFGMDDVATPATLDVETPGWATSWSSLVKGQQNVSLSAEDLTQSANVVGKQETEQEKARRLWQADQKRRWSRLPEWMFEEFGDVAELVD